MNVVRCVRMCSQNHVVCCEIVLSKHIYPLYLTSATHCDTVAQTLSARVGPSPLRWKRTRCGAPPVSSTSAESTKPEVRACNKRAVEAR